MFSTAARPLTGALARWEERRGCGQVSPLLDRHYPYILSRLDIHDFGTWVLMAIFISAFNLGQVPLFDLGGVFMKYISEYYTYDDYEGINRVLVCGLFFYGLFGIALTSGGVLLERPLFHLFHISDGASSAYFLVLVASAISNISAMLLAVFKGIQRMDKSNSLEIRLSILNAAGTIVFSGSAGEYLALRRMRCSTRALP